MSALELGRVHDGEVSQGRLGAGVGEARPRPQGPWEGQHSFAIFKVVVKNVCNIRFIIVTIFNCIVQWH